MAQGTASGLRRLVTSVHGRPATYATAGDGAPVVFLHGWGLGHRSYARALERIVRRGVRVYAPAMPGFGGTPALPPAAFSIRGYAAWVDAFCAAVGIEEPVTLVGHSFGGGVAIRVAHDRPARVARLVLINSIGGSAWRSGALARSIAERPLWDWGLHFRRDVLPLRQILRVLPVILEDVAPNLLRSPGSIWRVGNLARTADLTAELEELKRRRLPVVILWGDSDTVIPKATFDSLCEAAGVGAEGGGVVTVEGSHSWLLADPASFGEVMTNIVGFAVAADDLDDEARTGTEG